MASTILYGKVLLDVTCSKHLPEPAYCILANYALPFVESEAFIVESQTDKVVFVVP